MVGGIETGVQTLYYGLGIIFMLGGVVTASAKALQVRIGRHEKEFVDYKLYVAERYASKEFLAESKRGILDSTLALTGIDPPLLTGTDPPSGLIHRRSREISSQLLEKLLDRERLIESHCTLCVA